MAWSASNASAELGDTWWAPAELDHPASNDTPTWSALLAATATTLKPHLWDETAGTGGTGSFSGSFNHSSSAVVQNRVVRLLLLSAASALGSVGHVFIISAVLMDDHLKHRGNVWLVSLSLSDLLVCGIALPGATVGLLAGFQPSDWDVICRVQWACSLGAALSAAPAHAAAAADLRLRLALGYDRYMGVATMTRLGFMLALVWLSATAVLLTFLTLPLGPDLCLDQLEDRPYATPWAWHLPVSLLGLQVLTPAFFAILLQISNGAALRRGGCKSPPLHGSPSFSPSSEAWLWRTQAFSFLLFLVCWVPVTVALAWALQTPTSVPLQLLHHCHWVALAKSCASPVLHGLVNKHFREAFISLFHYCCCKTSVSFSRRVRSESLRPASDVRVHIIPGYNVYSAVAQTPHRTTTVRPPPKVSSRPKAPPRKTKSHSSKDVYEL